VEPESRAARRVPAHERLLEVDILGARVGAEEPARRRDPRRRAAERDIYSETRLARLAHGALQHQLEQIELYAVVGEIEHPQLIRPRIGSIQVERVAGREEAVERHLIEP